MRWWTLSTPKILTLLAKSLIQLHEPEPWKATPWTLYTHFIYDFIYYYTCHTKEAVFKFEMPVGFIG